MTLQTPNGSIGSESISGDDYLHVKPVYGATGTATLPSVTAGFPMRTVQDIELLDGMNGTTGWTVLGNDAINLATHANHVTGTASLEFDKVDGAAGTIFAGIQKTITSVDLSRYDIHSVVRTLIYVSATTNIAYAFVRLGTDASNYSQWQLVDSSITGALWQVFEVQLHSVNFTVVGTGWNQAAVTYAAVGLAFDAETDALADIKFDHLAVVGKLA